MCRGSFCSSPSLYFSTSACQLDVGGNTSFSHEYIPETDFIGQDSFMYELTVVDHEGNETSSVARISIDVVEASCDSMVYPLYQVLQKPLEEFYIFNPFQPHPLCDVFQWEVDSLVVSNGEAEVTADGNIKYYPAEDHSSDHIAYVVIFGSKKFHNYISVEIKESDCLEAIDDEYYLYIVGDSIGMSNEPYILDPVENDQYCTDGFTIRLIDEPTIGEAVVIDQQVQYYSDEEFSGIQETFFAYEICDGLCDTARIDLTLEKIY